MNAFSTSLALALALAALPLAVSAATLTPYVSSPTVSQSAPFKQISIRFSSGNDGQISAVEGNFNFDATKFTVYSITSMYPHECRYVPSGRVSVSAYKDVSPFYFGNQTILDFCSVTLRLKPGIAAGNSAVYFSQVEGLLNTGYTTYSILGINTVLTVQ